MNGAPGAVFFDVQAGQTITKSAQEFATLIGVSDTNKYVNVQNTGAVMGHFKVTFTNIS